MARLVTDSPVTITQGPWYLTTQIICPFCVRPFYLTPENVMATLAANIGATGTRHIGWQQLDEARNIDSANLNIDPAQVEGECPFCHYFPVNQHGPRYGLAKVTLNTDTVMSDVQAQINTHGFTSVGFFLTRSGALWGVYFLPSGEPLTDAMGAYASAVTRNADGTVDGAAIYLLHTPGQRITLTQAQSFDSGLLDYLSRFKLTLV